VHPDRVVVPKKVPDAATPMRFARVLRDGNQAAYPLGTQARALSEHAVIYHPNRARNACDAGTTNLHPTLGEVLPIDADPKQIHRIITTQQQLQPATGRALDLNL
jgi:hypothetical protein